MSVVRDLLAGATISTETLDLLEKNDLLDAENLASPLLTIAEIQTITNCTIGTALKIKRLADTLVNPKVKTVDEQITAPTVVTLQPAASTPDLTMLTALARVMNPLEIKDMKLPELLQHAMAAPAVEDQVEITHRLEELARQQLGRYAANPCLCFRDGNLDGGKTLELWAEVRKATGDVSWPKAWDGCILKPIRELYDVGNVTYSPTSGKQLLRGRDGLTDWSKLKVRDLAFVAWAKHQAGEFTNWRDDDIIAAVTGEKLSDLYKAFEHQCSSDSAFTAMWESRVYRKPSPPSTGVMMRDGGQSRSFTYQDTPHWK